MSKNADVILRQCLTMGMPVRLSERDGQFICIVEKAWITITADTLDDAIIEACTKALTNES